MFKNLMMILLLSSCSLTYEYKTKDIKKNYKKYAKESSKTRKLIKTQISDQKVVLTEIKKYKPKDKLMSSLNKNHQSLIKTSGEVQKIHEAIQKRYQKISLKKKSIRSTDEKNYNRVKSYNEFAKDNVGSLNKKLKSAQKSIKSFYKSLEGEGYYLIKASTLKNRFTKSEKKFTKSYKKTKKEISSFMKKLKKHSHKNKKKMLAKAKNLKVILEKVNGLKDNVKELVFKFDKKYANTEKILHGPGSSTYNELKDIEAYGVSMNSEARKFKKIAKQINQLAKE
jgi:hypothetical protein